MGSLMINSLHNHCRVWGWKKNWKSVNICRSYGQLSTGSYFMKHGVYTHTRVIVDSCRPTIEKYKKDTKNTVPPKTVQQSQFTNRRKRHRELGNMRLLGVSFGLAMWTAVQSQSHYCSLHKSIFSSAKEVMFSPMCVCVSVNRITHKLLIKLL